VAKQENGENPPRQHGMACLLRFRRLDFAVCGHQSWRCFGQLDLVSLSQIAAVFA